MINVDAHNVPHARPRYMYRKELGFAPLSKIDHLLNLYIISHRDRRYSYRRQAGASDNKDVLSHAVAARADGSVVLAGMSYGTFAGKLSTTDGHSDFAAVAIDKNGNELWRWQVLQLLFVRCMLGTY